MAKGKCDECGKTIISYYDFNGKKLCIGCYADIDDADIKKSKEYEETSTPRKIELKTYNTRSGAYLRVLGIISGIICILAGINMLTIQSVASVTGQQISIMEAYYNSMGAFVIGFGIFIMALLWGIADIIDKK